MEILAIIVILTGLVLLIVGRNVPKYLPPNYQEEDDGFLQLTDSGLEVAQKVFERHTIVSRFLVELGVDEATAVEDACKIEHVISDASLAAIKAHLEK